MLRLDQRDLRNNEVNFMWVVVGGMQAKTETSRIVAQLELELLRPCQFHSIFLMVIATLPILVVSIIFTALTDKLCCCCCNPREQLSVYHPDLDKRYILFNGEVVEDVETPREEIVKLDICIIHLLKWSKVSSQCHMTG